MNLYIRFCKKCKKPYDMGINYETCPECRGKQMEEKWKEENE